MDHTITTKSISHHFGKREILRDINFSCGTGDILAVFGRNGCGKSTLLKILFGTLAPDKGDVLVDDELINDKTQLNKFVAYHHQEVFLPKTQTVRNLIPLYFPDGEKQNKLFHETGMNKIERQKIGLLSAGEQRWVQFLFLVNLNHHFVLLDEPFSMVEPFYKELIKEKIAGYKGIKGFIITDHYYQDVLEVATHKKIIVDGMMKDIKENKELIEMGYLSKRSSNNL